MCSLFLSFSYACLSAPPSLLSFFSVSVPAVCTPLIQLDSCRCEYRQVGSLHGGGAGWSAGSVALQGESSALLHCDRGVETGWCPC